MLLTDRVSDRVVLSLMEGKIGQKSHLISEAYIAYITAKLSIQSPVYLAISTNTHALHMPYVLLHIHVCIGMYMYMYKNAFIHYLYSGECKSSYGLFPQNSSPIHH